MQVQPCAFKNLGTAWELSIKVSKKKYEMINCICCQNVTKVSLNMPKLSVKLSICLVQSYCKSCTVLREGDGAIKPRFGLILSCG